jgi:hypothetical protein
MRIVKRLHIAKFGMGVKSPYLATGTGGTPMPWRAGSNGGTTPSPKPPVGSGTNLKGVTVLRCYRLRTSSSGLQKGVTHPIAISIPAGAIVRVPNNTANAVGFVEVEWDGETVQMFAVDLRDRGELINAMSGTSGIK